MKRETRARPVDLWRRLQIVRSLDDAMDEPPDGLERSTSISSMMAAPLERSQSSSQLERAQSMVTLRPKAEIPTPIVEEVADYEMTVSASYQLPKSYIRGAKKIPLLATDQEPVEYNLDHEDEEWLQNHRLLGPKGDMAGCLEPDRMERMIDELEKAVGPGDPMSPTLAESLLERKLSLQPVGSDLKVIQEVYQYWVGKRQRMKKSLLRRFWPVTSINDTNPHLVFRPREKERYKLRKHRKNDMDSFRKMQTLRRDFDRLKDILELVKRRERLKLIQVQLEEQQFLQTLAEITGQQRKPVIPKEGPAREDLKLKIRVRSATWGDLPTPSISEERSRKRRHRDEIDVPLPVDGVTHRRTAQDSSQDVDRLKESVGSGFKERDQALATPDYLPSFMEDHSLRRAGRAKPLPQAPFTDGWANYGWRPSSGMAKGRGGHIGHIRSGVCAAPRCPPIEYNNRDTVRFRCRPRIGRGGRLLLDRVPMVEVDENLLDLLTEPESDSMQCITTGVDKAKGDGRPADQPQGPPTQPSGQPPARQQPDQPQQPPQPSQPAPPPTHPAAPAPAQPVPPTQPPPASTGTLQPPAAPQAGSAPRPQAATVPAPQGLAPQQPAPAPAQPQKPVAMDVSAPHAAPGPAPAPVPAVTSAPAPPPMQAPQSKAVAMDVASTDDEVPSSPRAILAGSTSLKYLDRYPSIDLLAVDLFKYPSKYNDIVEYEDNEDELLEPAEDAPYSYFLPEPLTHMPNRPPPPDNGALIITKFRLRL